MTGSRTKEMDLADFIAEKLKSESYRQIAKKTGVSRGALEAIVKREEREERDGGGFPKIGTLVRIAKAYGRPLWEIVEMAGADLNLPMNDTNRARRLAQLVVRQPKLESVARRLLAKMDTNPDYVDGIIAGIEAALGDETPQ